MGKLTKPLMIILVIVLIVLVGVILYDHFGASGGEVTNGQNKKPAPDITLTDAGQNTVSLSDFRGKAVVLNFWASWCGPCKNEMPRIEKVYKELGGEVEFLMVNLTYGRETLANAQKYIQNNGYTFNVYYDTEGKASTAYAVSSIPMTLFIDKDGNIVKSHIGEITESALRSNIAAAQK